MNDRDDVTVLLTRWRQGDRRALRQLMPVVYTELRRIADRSMVRERGDHTLQATALVHEAFVRLFEGQPPTVKDRRHFYALAARVMRRVLVDHARTLKAARRGGGALKISLEQAEEPVSSPVTDLLDLDQALTALAKVDRRKARIVEMRFFAGLEVKETAELLGVSVPTVLADSRIARAWLWDRISGAAAVDQHASGEHPAGGQRIGEQPIGEQPS